MTDTDEQPDHVHLPDAARRAEAERLAESEFLGVRYTNPDDRKIWRAGFAAGWEARDRRDDEPPNVHAVVRVWYGSAVRPNVAIRRQFPGVSGPDRWSVSGPSIRPVRWDELLQGATNWELLDAGTAEEETKP